MRWHRSGCASSSSAMDTSPTRASRLCVAPGRPEGMSASRPRARGDSTSGRQRMLRGVHHVSLTVHDMDAMLGFYKETLGFEQVAQLGWDRGNAEVDAILGLTDSAADVRILRAGNTYFELIHYFAPAGAEVD